MPDLPFKGDVSDFLNTKEGGRSARAVRHAWSKRTSRSARIELLGWRKVPIFGVIMFLGGRRVYFVLFPSSSSQLFVRFLISP